MLLWSNVPIFGVIECTSEHSLQITELYKAHPKWTLHLISVSDDCYLPQGFVWKFIDMQPHLPPLKAQKSYNHVHTWVTVEKENVLLDFSAVNWSFITMLQHWFNQILLHSIRNWKVIDYRLRQHVTALAPHTQPHTQALPHSHCTNLGSDACMMKSKAFYMQNSRIINAEFRCPPFIFKWVMISVVFTVFLSWVF